MIVGTIDSHRAGFRPDLKQVIVLNVWVILLPRCGHLDEILAVGFPAKTTSGAVGPLIVFALMPEDSADAMREPRLFDAPEQTSVNRSQIFGVPGIALVLIDARPAHRSVDDANRNFLTLDKTLGEIESP